MTTVSVVYHSGSGQTRALAEAVAAGARRVADVQVHLLEITGAQVIDGRWSDAATMELLDASDAIVFGAPTYMGSISAVFKAFMEKAFDQWLGQGWKDKLAGGFISSASQSGDKLLSLQQLAVFAAQMNMQWISVGDGPGNNWSGGTRYDINRLGAWLGVMSQSNIDEGGDALSRYGDQVTAERYGERVARLTARWVDGTSYDVERSTMDEHRTASAKVASEALARVER